MLQVHGDPSGQRDLVTVLAQLQTSKQCENMHANRGTFNTCTDVVVVNNNNYYASNQSKTTSSPPLK